MKKLISFLICLSLLCSFCVLSYADSKTYAIDVNGLSMTIDIPDHYTVYTDDIGINEERMKEFGEMGEMALQEDSAGIALEAWDENTRTEIAVTCVNSVLGDYNQFSNSSLLALSTAYESMMKQFGGKVYSSTVYQGAQAKFLRYVAVIPHQDGADGYDHMIQYNTVYGDQTVNITLHSYNGEPTEDTAAELEEVVKSARFGANPVAAPEAEQTPSFVYTDKETGVSFTVPANWKETPLSKEREVLKTKFSSAEEGGLSMMYGYIDFYPVFQELGVLEGYSREEVNQDLFTVQDMSILLSIAEAASEGDTEAPQVTGVQYGGIDYFKTVTKGDVEKYGLTFKSVMTNLYHFDNGYMYEFLFGGTEDSPFYAAFEEMVSSVQFSDSKSGSDFNIEASANALQGNDKSSLPEISMGLDFDMTPDQVHDLLGQPDDSDSDYAVLTEYYENNYAYRPLDLDRSGSWQDALTYTCFCVDYENRPSGLGINGFAFYAYYKNNSEDILDMFLEFISKITEYYGGQPETETPEEDRYVCRWHDDDTMALLSLKFQDDVIRLYFNIYDAKYMSVE